MAWTNRLGAGFWALTRYDDIARAVRDTATFSSGLGPPRLGPVPSPPIEVDRPEHTAYRRVLQPFFSPEHIRRLEPRVRDLAVSMLDPLIASGSADFAEAFSYPFPARVLSLLLGLPGDDWAMLKDLAEEFFKAGEERDNDPGRRDRANEALLDYGRQLIAERRRMDLDPREDLVTGLLHAEMNGRPLSEEAVVGVMRLLLSAGHNSTTSSLGICALHLARDPGLQDELRRRPERLPAAIEEFLRHETPVMTTPRALAKDVEVGGRMMRAGEQVMLVWASANRDEEHFAEPDRCVIDRAPNDHMVFGRGIHRCLGQPVALMEIRVALEELLSRTSRVEVAGEVKRTNWERYGVTALPLSFS
ncbi:cytochrome P450 [Actinomadura nitritigenes]|uniref:cytochrome P450 n=1 Tax=Actinomadura nitritigenes TaxID=134602 RepID=UPI003D911D3A